MDASRIPIEDLPRILRQRKRHKYGAAQIIDSEGKAHWIEVDGIKFQSKREAKRWRQLREMQELGLIRNLKRQVPYKLVLHVTYKSDFEYDVVSSSEHAVEDSKGMRTREYLAKKREMLKQHGIRIREV